MNLFRECKSLTKAAPRKSNIPKADARANRPDTFAFGSKCSFLNSADAHFDTREDNSVLGKTPANAFAENQVE
jgi:hypothetical protein